MIGTTQAARQTYVVGSRRHPIARLNLRTAKTAGRFLISISLKRSPKREGFVKLVNTPWEGIFATLKVPAITDIIISRITITDKA